MNLRHELKDLQLKGMNGLHRTILKVSGGRWLNRPLGMPTVELHTVGRKSGKPRATLLTAPIHDEQHTVLIASKGGDDRNPEWYLNLVANPDIDLTIDGETRPMRARTASEAEKDEMWPAIVAANRGYAGYQKKTTRPIPVVVCEPRA